MITIKHLPISKLKLNPRNPRIIKDEAFNRLCESIKEDPEYFQARPILCNKKMVIFAGNQRYRAAVEIGLKKVPVIIMDNPKLEIKRMLRDNLSAGSWNMEILADDFKPEFLLEIGFSEDELENIKSETMLDEAKLDEIPAKPEKPVTKPGDLWILGNHRLLCGDSKNISDFKKLMNGDKAKLCFTSPPYNMNADMYANYKDNLKSKEYINFNLAVISNIKQFLSGFLFWNISYNKKSRWEFIEILYRIIRETGFQFLELIVWNKKAAMPILSKEMLTRQYEDILLIGDEENITQDLELWFCGRNNQKAYFNKKTGKAITNYWEIPVNKVQLQNHSACYPVSLPARGIHLMTGINDIVLDPFGGSGSTLIACEQKLRRCYMIELDPGYCDVIIKRWEDITGKKAVKKCQVK